MKINDKILIAFLVSVGLFSSAQAAQYVGTLSAKEKKALCAASADGTEPAVGTSPSGPDVIGQNGNR